MWDVDGLRDFTRRFVIEGLTDDGEGARPGGCGVLVVDETGFAKRGRTSAGVARQYSGALGGVWVAAHEVYGRDGAFRVFLEEHQLPYVVNSLLFGAGVGGVRGTTKPPVPGVVSRATTFGGGGFAGGSVMRSVRPSGGEPAVVHEPTQSPFDRSNGAAGRQIPFAVPPAPPGRTALREHVHSVGRDVATR